MSSSQVVQVFEHENRQNLCNSYLALSRLKVSSWISLKRNLSLLVDHGRSDLQHDV